MKTIRLTLEYDGRAFVGWQHQANGLSVQETVERALLQLLDEPVRLLSSGRTDAGVHARGMIAQFTTGRELPLTAYREGLNRLLPPEVAVRLAAEIAADAHPRFDARGKWYRYTLNPSLTRSPLLARSSWQVPPRLDLPAMTEGARAFVGRHDFAAFRTSGCDARTTVREIFSADLVPQDDLLHLDVRGSGFLRHMVRIMVGTLVEIGRGRRPAADVALLLSGAPGVIPGPNAPPQGLCLMEVWY